MNIRKPVPAAVMALLTAFATGSALAIAHSSDQYGSTQDDATNPSTYSSNPSAMGSSDVSDHALGAPEQGSDSAQVGSPAHSSEPPTQTYSPSYSPSDAASDTEPAHATIGPAVESSTTYGPTSDATIVTPSPEAATTTDETPTEPSAIVSPIDEPRYTPETGDAEYGSKLNRERSLPPAAVEPAARFNDATGQ